MDLPVVAHLLPAHNAFPPQHPAGTELRVEQVSLRQRRYRPIVVCAAFGDQNAAEQIGAMAIRRIRFGRIYRRLFQKLTRLDPWPYGLRMQRIIDKERAALIHIHNEPKVLSGLLAGLAKRPNLPVVVHVANQKPIPPELLPYVDCWVPCSRFMAQWLEVECGVDPKKISVIYTGVDIAGRPPRWRYDPALLAERREKYGITNTNAKVFVFAGRLVREKGVAEMLDAFAKVQANSKVPVHLLVAGNVREGKGPNNVKAVYGHAMADRMSAMPGVSWVGSLKPHDIHDFLVLGDVFLLPSLWDDPFPTVMIEAAAAGLPIVAGARGGITEFLQACPGQRFIDPADPEQLAEEMLRWLDNPSQSLETGQWLRQQVENSFDWSRVTNDFEDLYDRLLANPGSN